MKARVNAAIRPLWVVLTALTACAADAPSGTSQATIPQIANIGGVQIGYSTQEELARRWGEGLTVIGGHPNSGRRWRIRDTDWLIATDGFMYSERGLVIDEMEIKPRSATKTDTNAPLAKLDKSAFAWLGEISRGMTKTKVVAVLKRHSLKFRSQANAIVLEAEGFSPITSEVNRDLRHWVAKLAFKNGKLSSLGLSAG